MTVGPRFFRGLAFALVLAVPLWALIALAAVIVLKALGGTP
jgi:hypothetical protein